MALTGIVIGGGTAGTGSVGVPDVLDLPQAEAEAKLRDFGLVPRIQTIEADGTEGTVFSQNPAARTIRARGTVVTLLVNKAPVVPPNLGQQLSDLQAAVDDLTVKVDGVVPAVQAVGGQVDAVGGQVDAVGGKVDAVSGQVDAVGTKVDGIGTAVTGIDTALAEVETETAADTRAKAIIDKLDQLDQLDKAAKARGGEPAAGTTRRRT
jgi:outer membrane murein-binding lipoprotein Lpp